MTTENTNTDGPISYVAWQAFPETDHRFGKMRPVGSSRDREAMEFLAGPRGKVTLHATSKEALSAQMKNELRDASSFAAPKSINWTYLGDGDWTSGKVRNSGEPKRGEYHARHHDPMGEACTLTFPDGETFTGTSRECRNRAEAHMNGETA